jgi:hypothetical protein
MQPMPDDMPPGAKGGGVAGAPPQHNGAGRHGSDGDDDRPPSRLLRISLLAALVVLAGLWAYALVYSVTRRDPERLSAHDRQAVSQACRQAANGLRNLAPLPNPPTNATVSARAASETKVLERMVNRARQVHPARNASRVALTGWLDDWDTLLDARDTYAREVVNDKGVELVIPSVNGSPIYVRMDKYATGKGLDACRVDALGATNVYAFRKP